VQTLFGEYKWSKPEKQTKIEKKNEPRRHS
jgi:hypothetical protein